ncbi:sugar kinase [Saccharopolyspora cebuensis]|uniref:Sugar kinase n=1 Tax=Saccharopolyspora cebuensis TaxID=418759 RepID=A0ABV4CFN4_9PSEU
MSGIDVLAMGEPLVEFNAGTDGDLAGSETFSRGYGGDTSNFIIAAARSGARTEYLTRIGDDAFGTALGDLWRREGVGTPHVVREAGGRTGIYFIARNGGEHAFTYYRHDSPATRLSPADVTGEVIARARLVHLTGITQAISHSACDAAFHAMALARERGVLVSYDPNHRPGLWATERARAVILRSLALCDIALPNLDEGRMLTGADQPRDVLAALRELCPGTVVLKNGAQGALLADGATIAEIPAPPVASVDASGAGDAFDGAFAARLLGGGGPAEAARYAAAAAALSTTGHGAVRPIPHHEDVLELL